MPRYGFEPLSPDVARLSGRRHYVTSHVPRREFPRRGLTGETRTLDDWFVGPTSLPLDDSEIRCQCSGIRTRVILAPGQVPFL